MLMEESFWSSLEPRRHRAVQRLRKKRALSNLASRCFRTVSAEAWDGSQNSGDQAVHE